MNSLDEKVLFALLLDLWKDISDPAFYWQLLALAVCLLLAWLLARYGRRHELAQASDEHGAWRAFGTGSLRRLFFPLLALLLVLIARKVFKVWHLAPVSLLDVAVPLMTSMALVRVVIYFLRYAFSPSGWLVSSERFVSTLIWIGLALHLSGLAEPLIELLEQVTLHIGKQKLDLWTLLNGLVTVIATVIIALWLSGLIEKRLLHSETIDANLPKAAATAAPQEIPARMPSSRASRRAYSIASSLLTCSISSTSDRSRLSGTKPAPMP